MVIAKDKEELERLMERQGYRNYSRTEFPVFIRRVEDGWLVHYTLTTVTAPDRSSIGYNLMHYFAEGGGEHRIIRLQDKHFVEIRERHRVVKSRNTALKRIEEAGPFEKAFGREEREKMLKECEADPVERGLIVRYLALADDGYRADAMFWNL